MIMAQKPAYEELKRRVQALEAENEKKEQFIRESRDGLYHLDLQNNEIEFYNDFFNFLFKGTDGKVTKKSIAKTLARSMSPEEMSAIKHEVAESLQSGKEGGEVDYKIQFPDGTWHWLHDRWKIVRDDRGNPIAIEGIIRDVTDLKKTEEALRESEAQYHQLFSTVPDAIMLFDAETKEFIDVNSAALKMYGYSEEEFLRLRHQDITAEQEGSENTIKQSLAGELTTIPLRYHRRKDGTLFPVEISVGKFKIRDRQFLCGIIRDISERKKAEEDRERLEVQLRQAQKMESIGNLAGGIAHDFNNILSSIIGYTELALDEVEKRTLLEDNLQEVYTAGKRARDLVKQILAFARQAEVELKPIQVSAIAKEALRLLRSAIPTSIEIRQNIESDSLIMGDATQVHQIFMNLCTNAAHAMEERGGSLEVSISDTQIDRNFTDDRIYLKPGDYLKIAIADTGPGISPRVIASIFEPYFTTKKPGEGTGMGLAAVHGIVKGYGGEIKVESEVGKGTVFTVYLPVTKKREVSAQYVPEILPLGNERILLIDDELPIVEMARLALERQGYKVTIRTSSVEALELFKQKPDDFDLVITDMTMPNMTGDNLAVELMKIRPDIPVILCTGYSKKISDERAAEIGIKAFAYKPIVKADLAKTVREVLDINKKKKITGQVLVIDDEPQVRSMLKQLLEKQGYEVNEACDGKEGIRLYRESPTDLIITDLVMPEKEGIEMIMGLKRDFPDVKIIAISGGGRTESESYLQMAKQLGAVRIFSKPIDREGLLKAVGELLS